MLKDAKPGNIITYSKLISVILNIKDNTAYCYVVHFYGDKIVGRGYDYIALDLKAKFSEEKQTELRKEFLRKLFA